MGKYRILNRQEVEAMGSDWRSQLGWNYSGLMDYLLGRPLDSAQSKRIQDGLYITIDNWSIRPDNTTINSEMYKGITVVPNGLLIQSS